MSAITVPYRLIIFKLYVVKRTKADAFTATDTLLGVNAVPEELLADAGGTGLVHDVGDVLVFKVVHC